MNLSLLFKNSIKLTSQPSSLLKKLRKSATYHNIQISNLCWVDFWGEGGRGLFDTNTNFFSSSLEFLKEIGGGICLQHYLIWIISKRKKNNWQKEKKLCDVSDLFLFWAHLLVCYGNKFSCIIINVWQRCKYNFYCIILYGNIDWVQQNQSWFLIILLGIVQTLILSQIHIPHIIRNEKIFEKRVQTNIRIYLKN